MVGWLSINILYLFIINKCTKAYILCHHVTVWNNQFPTFLSFFDFLVPVDLDDFMEELLEAEGESFIEEALERPGEAIVETIQDPNYYSSK